MGEESAGRKVTRRTRRTGMAGVEERSGREAEERMVEFCNGEGGGKRRERNGGGRGGGGIESVGEARLIEIGELEGGNRARRQWREMERKGSTAGGGGRWSDGEKGDVDHMCSVEGMAAWRSCGGGYGTAASRRWIGSDSGDGGGSNGDVLVVGARSGGSSSGGKDGGWTPSSTFCEQPLEREETPFLFSNDG